MLSKDQWQAEIERICAYYKADIDRIYQEAYDKLRKLGLTGVEAIEILDDAND